MKPARHTHIAIWLIGSFVIGLIGIAICMRHEASSSMSPLIVSLAKCQYEKNEPIQIKVSISNQFRRRITIRRSDFGLAERRGEDGFYIYDDIIRSKCQSHFISNTIVCGMNVMHLRPQQTMNETIEIPVEAELSPGTRTLYYELRIPFYGNTRQFGLAPGETITIYLDPRDRPMTDVWRERFRDFTNGNGEFVVKGKLKFAVK